MKSVINKVIACGVVLFSFFIFNIIVYNYLIYYQRKEYKLLLQTYANSISSLLTQDLENALNSSLSNKEFFLLKDFEVIPRSKTDINLIIVGLDAIKIRNQKEEYIFNLYNLKEIINKILPTFIIYELSLNNHNIFSEEVNEKTEYYLTESKLVEANDILILKLGIRKDSVFYLNKTYLLQRNILIFGISSFLILSVLLYFYLRINKHISKKFNILKQEIYKEKERNSALLNSNKVDHHLKQLFIKKLTEMYLKRELWKTNDLDNLFLENQPFPIYLTDLSLTKINIENLTRILQEYFAPYFAKISIRITNYIKDIEINCSIEVFYQLIFSLIFNLIKFMDRQSDIPQILNIDFKQDKIIIINNCFPLDERKMIKLSDIIIEEHMDIFVLNCYKIFKSLKEHKFQYHIFSHNSSHIIEIIYPSLNKSNTSNENITQVVDFTKYLDNKS